MDDQRKKASPSRSLWTCLSLRLLRQQSSSLQQLPKTPLSSNLVGQAGSLKLQTSLHHVEVWFDQSYQRTGSQLCGLDWGLGMGMDGALGHWVLKTFLVTRVCVNGPVRTRWSFIGRTTLLVWFYFLTNYLQTKHWWRSCRRRMPGILFRVGSSSVRCTGNELTLSWLTRYHTIWHKDLLEFSLVCIVHCWKKL